MKKTVFEILEKLEKNGFSAYLVGGCVRDEVSGRIPTDYDVTTNARPENIKRVFPDEKILCYGEKYGTIVIYKNHHCYEVTTFRTDGKYSDGRRPERVEFSDRLEDDLRRRDFTINAMAMDRFGNVTDPFSGAEDLKRGILRTVGDADQRFREDGLRILRAFRFIGRFHMRPDEALLKALYDNRHMLYHVSEERVLEEIFKILLEDRPSDAFYFMEKTKVLDILFPAFRKTVGFDQKTPYHIRTLFDHLMCVVDHTPPILAVRLAALFHDVAKVETLTIGEDGRGHFFGHEMLSAEMADAALSQWKASTHLRTSVKRLIQEHMKVHDIMTDKALRRQIKRVGKDLILDLYDLMIADCACTTVDRDTTMLQERKQRVEMLLKEPIMQSEHFLVINGNDLIEIGYRQGENIGRTIRKLREEVLDDPTKNERTYLLERAKNWMD